MRFSWAGLTIVFWSLGSRFYQRTQTSRFLTLKFHFAGLIDCDYYKTTEYNYSQFVNLNDVKDAQPTGYYARVPVYVIGARDGHIVLSKTNTPNRDTDFAYEFCTLHSVYDYCYLPALMTASNIISFNFFLLFALILPRLSIFLRMLFVVFNYSFWLSLCFIVLKTFVLNLVES